MLEAHLNMNGERVRVVIGKRELNAAELRWEARSIKPALVRFMNSTVRGEIKSRIRKLILIGQINNSLMKTFLLHDFDSGRRNNNFSLFLN